MGTKELTRKEKRILRAIKHKKMLEAERLTQLSKKLGTGYAHVALTKKELKPYENIDVDIMTNIRKRR